MRFETVTTLSQLKSIVTLVVDRDLMFSVDVETSGLKKRKDYIVGIGICFDKEYSVYVPVAHKYDQPFKAQDVIEIMRPMFEGNNKICFYSANFDLGFLRAAGFVIPWNRVSDVMLMAHVLSKFKNMKLSGVAKEELDLEVWDFPDFMKKVEIPIKKTIAEASITDVSEYCGRDVHATFCLYEKFYPKVFDVTIYKIENALMPCVDWMIENGVLVNKDFFFKEAERLGEKLLEVESIIKKMAQEANGGIELTDFNVASTKQVGNLLFDVLKLGSTKETKTGKRSTDEEALLDLKFAHPIVFNLLTYRGIAKQVSSYLKDYCEDYVEEDGKIHASFKQSGTATGRFSCADPNLQNIPNGDTWKIKKQDGSEEEVSSNIRKGFVVPVDCYFVEFDYSQIEARLAAGVTQEIQLVQAFKDGVDFHTKTASIIFKVPVSQVTKHQRRIGKTTNFSLIYGGSGQTLFAKMKKDMKITLDEAKLYAKAYRDGYMKMFMMADKISDDAQRSGYITTMFGRKVTIFDFEEIKKQWSGPDFESRKKKEQLTARGRRQAYNAVIQGSAADILKISMLKIYKKFKQLNWLDKVLLLMQVHDSLIFQVPKEYLLDILNLVPSLMLFSAEGFPDIPASVKVGKTWGEMEEKNDKESVEDFYARVTGEVNTKVDVGKSFILEFRDGATVKQDNIEEFKELVLTHPGSNEIVIRMAGEDDMVMTSSTSIGMESKEKIMMLMGGVFYERI